ncbi:methyltransferase domain-containing protein [Pelagibacterium sp. H642]|uniref:methyltransferase domain-containing protein n=1 Tax=Pelagibacterium sp. H642 TaxID=1881069 RepID=UPI00281629F8|nr:methyltransferase domain-containing protein [Pelagibacterium sp. H642]WMT89261.1 class I SAM-dependent methyltransferase [Pelagibacterium sp. H642]
MTTQPPLVFDRARLAANVARRNGASDFVTDLVIADLADRLAPVTRDFSRALIMGPDPRLLPKTAHSANGGIEFEIVSTLVPVSGFASVDPERLVLPESDYDLIVSLLDLQTVNDVPGFLASLRRHLAPDGLLIAALVGGRTLTELRDAFLAADVEMLGGVIPRVAPMIDVRDAGALLQRAGFALPVTDLETHTVRYRTPLALFDELRAIGATNPLLDRGQRFLTARHLMRAAEIYAEKFSDPDGRVRATLEILWLSGWAPHENQQKPLRPGSATTSLRDVLGDKSRT